MVIQNSLKLSMEAHTCHPSTEGGSKMSKCETSLIHVGSSKLAGLCCETWREMELGERTRESGEEKERKEVFSLCFPVQF